MKVCVVSFIVSKAFDTPLTNLLKILNKVTSKVYVLSGNIKGYSIKTKYKNVQINETIIKNQKNPLLKAISHMLLQIKITRKLIKLSKEVDCYLFFMEGVGLLPIFVSRVLRKKIIWMIPSSILLKSAEHRNKILHILLNSTQKISAMLASRIILYSPNLIDEWKLTEFREKIRFANEHFIDNDNFKITKDFENRKEIIGHIGRLSKEKGSMNFVHSIPGILKKDKKISFIIGGDGELSPKIKKYLANEKINGKAKMLGWIPKEKLPNQLNKLKLIVITSYTEGLPNVMLESMACGTPVLATPVGSIPDLIKHEKTGFIIKENSVKGIQRAIIRALKHKDLKKISQNAHKAVLEQYKMEVTIKKYKEILKELINQ